MIDENVRKKVKRIVKFDEKLQIKFRNFEDAHDKVISS